MMEPVMSQPKVFGPHMVDQRSYRAGNVICCVESTLLNMTDSPWLGRYHALYTIKRRFDQQTCETILSFFEDAWDDFQLILVDKALWADWFTLRSLTWCHNAKNPHDMVDQVLEDKISHIPLYYNVEDPLEQYFLYFVVVEMDGSKWLNCGWWFCSGYWIALDIVSRSLRGSARSWFFQASS